MTVNATKQSQAAVYAAVIAHLHYSVMGMLEVFKDYAMEKRRHKCLHKVAEERNLKPGEMIYLDISSQKKPSYGGSKN